MVCKAADQGDDSGQFMLGISYVEGKGVTKDFAEAAIWLHKAADHGNIGAYGPLGVMYAKGQGVTQDYIQAHKWFSLAARKTKNPGSAITARDRIASQMTPEELAEARRLAREWTPQ
ncbi:tetratricopeptide repeat protein [Mesorhizobium sp. M1406]|uniref:tetratricopeptide repeat protein n=1 Tax=Mesorhizobium sp. M1406 TaxID=2957099 RepID=UPI00333D0979